MNVIMMRIKPVGYHPTLGTYNVYSTILSCRPSNAGSTFRPLLMVE